MPNLGSYCIDTMQAPMIEAGKGGVILLSLTPGVSPAEAGRRALAGRPI